MNKMIVLFCALAAMASAQHWNNPNWAAGPAAPVQDTPEVAAAKAAHFAAVAQAQTQPQGPQQAQWGQPQNQWNAPQAQGRYQGPVALPPGFDQNGSPLPVQDTAEVAAEKAKHFSLTGGFGAPPQSYNQWNSAPQQQWNSAPQQQWNSAPQPQWNSAPQHNQWNSAPQQQWNSAPQHNQWNVQGQPGLPADTPEVAAAKAAHLAAHSQLRG